MTGRSTDLADFLRARYAEEEAIARDVEPEHYEQDAWDGMTWHCVEPLLQTFSPARVLAECAAKRLVIEAWQHESRGRDEIPARTPVAGALFWVMKQLALPYVAHPDYREEWRS